MALASSYSLDAVDLEIGPVSVSEGAYGTDGAIDWNWTQDVAAPRVGQNGRTIFVRNLERLVAVTITLQHVTPVYALLNQLLQRQWGDDSLLTPTPTRLVEYDFLLRDRISSEELTSATAVFTSRPAPSKNAEPGDAVFGLILVNPAVNTRTVGGATLPDLGDVAGAPGLFG